jgi:pSer/pThr/pTyr-binding forkhead associated (FHA) protein
VPVVHLIPDASIPPTDLQVKAEHQSLLNGRTAKLDPINGLSTVEPLPRRALNPQLVINGESTFYLTDDIINIGRSRDNQIVLDDPRISRHHAQLRRRTGIYWVFDTSSQSGTFVNNVAVREHALSAGDVIRLGKSQLVYLEDDIPDQETSGTAPFAG